MNADWPNRPPRRYDSTYLEFESLRRDAIALRIRGVQERLGRGLPRLRSCRDRDRLHESNHALRVFGVSAAADDSGLIEWRDWIETRSRTHRS